MLFDVVFNSISDSRNSLLVVSQAHQFCTSECSRSSERTLLLFEPHQPSFDLWLLHSQHVEMPTSIVSSKDRWSSAAATATIRSKTFAFRIAQLIRNFAAGMRSRVLLFTAMKVRMVKMMMVVGFRHGQGINLGWLAKREVNSSSFRDTYYLSASSLENRHL